MRLFKIRRARKSRVSQELYKIGGGPRMGNLSSETPLSEVTSLLEMLSSRGVTRSDLARLRANNGSNSLMDRVIECITSARSVEEYKYNDNVSRYVSLVELTGKAERCVCFLKEGLISRAYKMEHSRDCPLYGRKNTNTFLPETFSRIFKECYVKDGHSSSCLRA